MDRNKWCIRDHWTDFCVRDKTGSFVPVGAGWGHGRWQLQPEGARVSQGAVLQSSLEGAHSGWGPQSDRNDQSRCVDMVRLFIEDTACLVLLSSLWPSPMYWGQHRPLAAACCLLTGSSGSGVIKDRAFTHFVAYTVYPSTFKIASSILYYGCIAVYLFTS